MARGAVAVVRPLLAEARAWTCAQPPRSTGTQARSIASTSRLSFAAPPSKTADQQETTSSDDPPPPTPKPKRRGRPPGAEKETAVESVALSSRSRASTLGKKTVKRRIRPDAPITAPNRNGARPKGHVENLLPDPTTPFAHLPAPTFWRNVFNTERGFLKDHRYFVANEDTTRAVADRLDLARLRQEAGGEKLTIIECYPGPGSITRSLIQSEHVDRIIAIEENEGYAAFLKQLPSDPTLERVAHLEIVKKSPYRWTTYTDLVDEGMLDHIHGVKEKRLVPQSAGSYEKATGAIHEQEDWQRSSPLVVLFTLPNAVHGEQLFQQLVSAIATRLWLFRFGRIRMAFVCSEHLATRSLAEPGEKLRTRLSTFCDALTDRKMLLNSSHFEPLQSHIWPTTSTVGAQLPVSRLPGQVFNAPSGKTKEKLCFLSLDPKTRPLLSEEDMEPFEFITRNLFVLRSTPVGEALKHVAPGAQNVLNMLSTDHPAMRKLIENVNKDKPEHEQILPDNFRIDPETYVNDLTIHQWVALAKMFDRWPFRPENLLEEQMPSRIRRDR